MVRKLLILTKEEAQHVNPGTISSKGEETSSVADGADANVLNLSSSSPDLY